MSVNKTAAEKREHRIRAPHPVPKPDYSRSCIWNLPMQEDLPVYPFCVEEIERKNRTWFSESFCRFMIVTIVTEGNILYRLDGKEILISPPEILVIPQNASYFFRNGPSGYYKKIVLELMGKNLQSIAETLGLNQIRILRPDSQTEFIQVAREIGTLLQRQDMTQLPLLLGKTHQMLTALSILLRKEKETPELLVKAQMLLESAMEARMTLPEVAEKFGMSSATLNRLFKDKLGVTPMRYRLECKIAHARYLLMNTSLSVKEIAYKLGYCNPFYFSQEFHRITGATPCAIRRSRSI